MSHPVLVDGDYVPIACAFHERLEFAVLRRQRLRLRYRCDGMAEMEQTVLPVDVRTQDGAEWLDYRDADGRRDCLRLDWLMSADPV